MPASGCVSRPPLSMIGIFLLPQKFRTVFEPENQSAISICRNVIQQTAPEIFAELRYLPILLLQLSNEILDNAAMLEKITKFFIDELFLFFCRAKFLSNRIIAFPVFVLILCRGSVPMD